MGNQWWATGCNGLDVAATNYLPITGQMTSSSDSTTEAEVQSVISEAGTLKRMVITLSAAPGTDNSYAFKIYKNGVGTALTVTISGTSTTGTIAADVTVAAGDRLSIEYIPTSTPTTSNADIWIEFQPTTANNFTYPCGFGVTQISAAPQHCGLLSGSAASGAPGTDSEATRSVSPIAGTITKFYVKVATAPGAGKSWTFEILVNGVEDATAEVIIGETDTAVNVTDLAIAVAAGDYLTFQLKTETGVATATRAMSAAVTFVPTTPGQFAICTQADSGGTSTVAAFYGFYGKADVSVDYNGTETAVQRTVPTKLRAKALYARITTAPGASGDTYTFRSRVGAGNGNISFTIVDAATTGGAAGTDNYNAGNLIDIGITPSGPSPAAIGNSNFGIALEVPAGGGGGGGGQGGQGGGGGKPPSGGGGGGPGGGGPPGQQKRMVVGNRRLRRRGLALL